MNDSPKPGQKIAYFGRVSTPKQKLEQQFETVQRWAELNGIYIPDAMRFEDKIRRHEAATLFREREKRRASPGKNRFRFDALMDLIEAGNVDWIVVASFDRWGIRNKDEIFRFRSELSGMGVKLYSVIDSLDMTGTDDTDFLMVVLKAIAATGYVSQQAEKNVQKMVSMAERGWHASGNVPFGLDQVCYPLDNLNRPLWRVVRTRFKPAEFRVVSYSDTSRVERDANGIITASHVEVKSEEISSNMPARKEKTTGYRLEPSIDPQQLKAVRLIFDLAEQGHTFGVIANTLFDHGFTHYAKRFGSHAIETILSNPAYIGTPAWSKNGTGQYRQTFGKQPRLVERKATDTVVTKKAEAEWVFSAKPVFLPIVEPAIFERVKATLQARRLSNPTFGKVRTRNRAEHPLNGKLFCSDCNAPMVLGSFMPGSKTRGKRFHCFHCGTWRKTNRTKCNANTVRWETLDEATAELLATVGTRIASVESGSFNQREEWLARTKLGRMLCWMKAAVACEAGLLPEEQWGPTSEQVAFCVDFHEYLISRKEPVDPSRLTMEFFGSMIAGDRNFLEDDEKVQDHLATLVAVYNKRHSEQTADAQADLFEIDLQLRDIASILPKQIRNPTIYESLSKQAEDLEAKKSALAAKLVPLSLKAEQFSQSLRSIRETIKQADRLKMAALLDSFVERVEPIFEVQAVGKGKKRRTKVIGFRFIPKESDTFNPSGVMEHFLTRTGTGSSRRTARSPPGTWSNVPPG